MPAWKKVLTSGSAAAVSSLTSSGAISCSGVFTTEVIHGDLGEATGLEIAGYFSGSGATATGSFMTSIYSQGTILANTTVTATTDLLVGGNIQHLGNLTNEISFAANTQDYRTNNGSRLDISNSGIRLGGAGARVTSITDDDSLGTSDTLLCTQGNVKAYADTKLSLAGGTMTGQLNFNSQNAINVDLNSGTIDNCVIGASTAVAATFTDLTTTGDITLGNAITDQNTIQGHITASGAVSASGDIYSKTKQYWSTNARLTVDNNTSNYFGPNSQGTNYYYWNRDLGTSSTTITSKTQTMNSGWKLPYKAVLTGYHLNIQGRTSNDDISFTLVYCDGMFDGNVTSTSQTLVEAEGAQTVSIATQNNFYELDRRDQFAIPVGAMTMLYPRFKKTSTSAGTTGYDFQLAVEYYVVK